MSKFKPGDIVTLNSGGPGMTLETLGSGERVIVRCTWFDGPQKHSDNFVITSLKLYKSAQPTAVKPEPFDTKPVRSIVGLVTKKASF